MAQPTIIQGDLLATGNVAGKTLTIPNGSVGPAQIAAGAPGSYIPSGTMRQKFRRLFSQDSTAVAATETKTIHLVVGQTATLIGLLAGLISPCIGAATVTVDLKVSGVSLLTAPITLNNTQIARQTVTAVIATAALTVGQVVEVVITATASTGTLGDGLFVCATIDEDPA